MASLYPRLEAEGFEYPTTRELVKATGEPLVFVNNYCRIKPATGGQAIRFRLWEPAQREVLEEIDRQRMLIVLKARQLGLSWLALAWGLWHTNCGHGKTMLILNRQQEAAAELLERVKFMHARLPPWLQSRVGRSNRHELEFPDMGSIIYSLPTTEFSGTGLTATFVMFDEWAKLSWTEQLWASIQPTISAGGKFVGVSTAWGRHNQFARMWRAAVDGESELYPLFLPWDAHPARDDAWYERERKNWRAATAENRKIKSDRLFEREYPRKPSEAFATTGLEVFGDEWDRATHTFTGEARPEGHWQWPQWRGIDFGYHHSPVYWARVEQDRTVVIHHELAAEGLTTDELGQAILEEEQRLGMWEGLPDDRQPLTIRTGVDPSGFSKSTTGPPDTAILARHGIICESLNVDPDDRVDLIKSLLRTHRVLIHVQSCPRLVEALEMAEWDTKSQTDQTPKETYKKDGLYEHPLDSSGYMLICMFPPEGSASGHKVETAVGSGVGGYDDGPY